MTTFAFSLEPYLPYLPIAVGCGVGMIVLTMFSLRVRRGGSFAPPAPQAPKSETDAPDVSFGNRRGAVRRDGAPVKVVLSSPSFKNQTDDGYVVDRSTGGLRIAMGVAMAPGSTMQVRACNAPDTIPWVTVIIRNCRNAGQHFEVGCEFDRTPPWNILLLFG